MKSVVGVFVNAKDAGQAVHKLRSIGIRDEDITLLAPGATLEQLEAVPKTETEQPGMGKAVGGVVGAAVGGATGIHLAGLAATSLVVPGIGPVLGLGLAAAGVLAGIVGGATVGAKLEDTLDKGVPVDELHVYEDALRQGRTVVLVEAPRERADEVRRLIDQAGAESLDAARERWWIGLRPAEAEHYEAAADFGQDEPWFRRGFEAALRPACRGRSFNEMKAVLQKSDPEEASHAAFERGYERGRAWLARKA